MLSAALISGLLSSGCEVHEGGVLPTPAIAYLTDKLSFDLGIVVTASHNPFGDNGIKLFFRGGKKCDSSVERHIEEYLFGKRRHACASGRGIGRVYTSVCSGEYIDFLTSRFSSVGKGIRVGLDTANGAAYKTARSVLRAVGCSVEAIGDSPDGSNINEGVGALHPDALSELVKKRGLDVGFALDGDGDRCIAVTDKGTVTDGDGILYVLAKRKKAQGVLKNSSVAATVTSNGALKDALLSEGISLAVTPVGDRALADKMRECDISLGGEKSGHIIDADIFPIGDGTATALSILSAMRESGESLSSLVSGFKPHPTVSLDIAVKDKESVLLSDAVISAKMRAEELLGNGSRLLLRASGTENKIRILAECPDEKRCLSAVEIIKNAISVFSK
jgi:phosphoglucosamine mutase